MAANTAPIFALVPEVKMTTITATTTDKTGATTTNIKTLVTGATNGTKVTQIGFKFQGTSTAGCFLIWIDDGTGTLRLFDEILMSAVTSSATAITHRIVIAYADLQLKSGEIIKVGATTVNTSIEAFAQIGDY